MNTNKGLVWFGNDCRINDNNLILRAAREVKELVCVTLPYYRLFSAQQQDDDFSMARSEHVERFERESSIALSQSLMHYGHSLYELDDLAHLIEIIRDNKIQVLYRAFHPGLYEQDALCHIQRVFPRLDIVTSYSLSLFHESQLPFDALNAPATFTQFRKQVEPLTIVKPLALPNQLPEAFAIQARQVSVIGTVKKLGQRFIGGETFAQQHLAHYFQSTLPNHYKEVRNHLQGWDNSTKLAPWLSSGNLSPRQVWSSINEYERANGGNDSTYWIKFELLWREFFHWYTHWHQEKLFLSGGINKVESHWDTDQETFEAWTQGKTGYDIVDACMLQLKHTGFISNRGRQLVASCLIHELKLDWRLGALYFEHNLIDYDVGSNWGNWQYIAGVGADAKPVRRFDLVKQTQMYDPNRTFVDSWLKQDLKQCG